MSVARLLPALTVALATALGCFQAASTHPVSIDLRARQLLPGEPVRIEVTSAEPIESLEAEFLDRPVFLVREDGDRPGWERWSGWAIITLDEKPGPAVVEAHGRTRTGRPVVGTRAIRIEPRSFPEEQLKVKPRFVEPPPEARERLARERRKLASLYGLRRPASPPTKAFVRPVPGAPTSVFGTRRIFNGKPRSPHPGLDLRAATGTPVHGAGSGRVGLAQDLYYAGNTVILDHGGGLFTIYAHLSELLVREGDEIDVGQLIGRSGATGRVTGPHLHWGAKIGDLPFDPTALLDPDLFLSVPGHQ
jgi:murein DD-endopeptidase MepM/ murein hydrolase activator NlpD